MFCLCISVYLGLIKGGLGGGFVGLDRREWSLESLLF